MDNQYFKISRPEPWLYSIKDRMEVYCWLIVGQRSALLLDAGYGIGDLPAVVRSLTDKPLTVLLSHGHADHVLGAAQFEQVLLHPADFELFNEHNGEKWRRKAVDAIQENKGKIDYSFDGFDFDGYLEKGGCEPTPLHESAEFDLGALTVSVIPMGGHTPGSVGLLIREQKVLLTGDASNRAEFMFMPESLKLSSYIDMLRRVSRLDFDIHYTGHQEKAYPKKWFAKYIKVAENAMAGKGKPMTIPGFEEYGEVLVSSIGGPVLSPAFCAVGYSREKLMRSADRKESEVRSQKSE